MSRVKNLPDGWKKKLISDFSNVVRGGSPRPAGSPLYFNGDYLPWITVKEVTKDNSMFLTRTESFLTKAGSERTRIIEAGTFILTNSGATLGVPKITKIKAGANDGIAMILEPQGATNDFLYFYFSSLTKFLRESAAPGNGQPNLNTEIIGNLPILLPPLPEQKAIADLLSTWDEGIEKSERLIVKKQKFYEAQLSKHLSLNISERIKLNKFLKEVSKRNRDLSITQVLSVTNSKGFVRPEDQFDRQVASDNISNYKIVSKGEYAYNPSRINVGSIARLDGWDVGVLSPMYTVFQIKKPSELHTDLFLHWLNSHEAKQRIKLSAQGSVRETVSFDDFCAIGFPKIDFKQQKALAEYFNLISAEIDSLKALADKYKTQKRGLMQKMLTGEWRVKPEIVNQYMEA